MESASSSWDMSSMFRRLRLWDYPGFVVTSSPPLPMITYDKGLTSLPDDVIHEIFGLLDTGALKSCSLAGKVISLSAKPFVHRTLFLIPRPVIPRRKGFNSPGRQTELKGLATLGERGLLQHTRHLSISLPCNPLFAHDLQPHIQHLRALTNVKSFKTRWFDTPSFIARMESYFGGFLGSLQSLELEFPRGDHKQILYFICQFPNLRDLKIKGLQDYTHSIRSGGPHFDIGTSPLLNGTLDLELNTGSNRGAQLILDNLVILPSGLRFRTIKLSGCTGNNPQLLVDACAPTLECMDFTGHWFTGGTECARLSFKRHPTFRKFEIRLPQCTNTELVAVWLFGTLSTITSNVFTELTINIARVSFSFHTADESQVRAWNSVDNVLDRLSLCEDVTLVVRPQHWVIEDKFKELIEIYFPLMWENGRVVLERPPPYMDDGPVRRMRVSGPGQIF